MSWVVYELTDALGTAFFIRAWDHEQMAEKLRWIHWSYRGFGLTAKHRPGMGFSDCNNDGDWLVKSGQQSLENQRHVPITKARQDEEAGIRAHYDNCAKLGIDSGD